MSNTVLNEHQELPEEFYDLIQPRLRMNQRGLGSMKHKRLMESLYQEYIDSMGKLTRERVQPLFVILDEGDKLWGNEMDTIKNDVL
ncbi:hypothetical protein SEA_EFFIE_560 [Acinetobacter phage Effie]|nr:hypothetical protein SEA_EFFIE_560 [Acinetobacter phage Effie]